MTVESTENVSEGNEQVRKVSMQCGLCWSTVCCDMFWCVMYTGHQESSKP